MSGPKFSRSAFSALAFAVAPLHPDSGSYARMMLALLPPGKLWRFIGSTLADAFTGFADELGRVDERAADLLSESDPSTAIELLPELEAELDLVAAASVEERRGNIVAKLIRRQRFRPVDFQDALAELLAQTPAAVVVIERTRAFAISVGDDKEIYRFFIYRNPALAGTYFIASAQARLDEMKPSHTKGYVIESISLLCDDPFSLCDRDLLGA